MALEINPKLIAAEIKANNQERRDDLRDEFALKLAPSVYKDIICETNQEYAHSLYRIADALVKESEKYRNGEIKHSNSNK